MTDNGNSVVEDDGVFRVEDLVLDLPAVVGAFRQRLHDAGLPVTPSQTQEYARSLVLTTPFSRPRLYWPTGSVSGISGNVDTNEFKGTLAELIAFTKAAPAKPDAGSPSAPSDDGGAPQPPTAGAAAGGSVMGDGVRATPELGAATCP